MKIRLDDLSGPAVAEFLQEHIEEMSAISPAESMHALDLGGLRQPNVTFWTVWDDEALVGCGALKEIDAELGELKSMRTSSKHKQRGIASMLLQHVIGEAKRRGYRRLSLETGSMPFFEPAIKMYAKFGFETCGPFSSYEEDPNSVFMTMALS